jgi:hypothetical protein
VATSYWFEYGTTTAYGPTTAATDAATGTAAATLAGLTPGTTYHYRLVAANSGVAARGADQTFTTTASPAPPPPVIAPASGFAGVRLVSRTLSFTGRAVTLKLRCPAGTAGGCAGTTRLTARRVRLGRARFAIPAGHARTVKVRVSRAGRRLLARSRRVAGRDASAARDGTGHARTTTARVTISRRRG